MIKRGGRFSKTLYGSATIRGTVIVAFVVVVFLVLTLLFREDDGKGSSLTTVEKWNKFDNVVRFQPTMETINGTVLIWQIPDEPKAVLFLAHGCNGKAENFWDRTSSCLGCVGLPEERLIVLHALFRKFAVLTVSSFGRCWSFGSEKLVVAGTVKWWIEEQKLEKLPLVALGASSGGYFVSALATDLRFSSITLMIAEGLFSRMDIPKDYPPTLFVHMPKDEDRKLRVDENLKVLKKMGVDAAEIKCMEFPLSPAFLADRIPNLDRKISVELFKLFQEKGFIDKNGFMKNDGRATRWKAAANERKILSRNKDIFNHIQEELNLAFAYHEMTSLQSEQIFSWFESHLK
ncbi:hypothetical protein DCAR_0311062 [Daucus carota subsp. sativus]|uniref:Peptidase S9 prolyl oligopeptidase catalytic domain-containing protein n=1 Tax=Daucus carota subsp. sativus TaxID=79200 RepID=A0A166ACD0_DAUCS|nr:PREDICTED: uncharacterized protein LOC108214996 [Daucus carota subsp. sativus]WOG91808.1 hypothetical protein DCAR_0311062 [Daucus carota subsp. sativus]